MKRVEDLMESFGEQRLFQLCGAEEQNAVWILETTAWEAKRR